MMRGKLKQAKDICEQMLNLANENGILQTGVVGGLYSSLGMILCEWNELGEGVRLIKKGIELSEQGRDPVALASCRINLLRASIYRGDFAVVADVMEELNKSMNDFRLPPWITNTIAAFNAFGFLAADNLNGAVQWAKERNLSVDGKLSNLHELEYITLAHILIAQQQLNDADRLFERLIENAKDGDRVYIMIEMHLGRALLYKTKQDIIAALAELKMALSLAEPGGLIMIFVSKGKPVAELLDDVIADKKHNPNDPMAGFSLSYAKKLLSAFRAFEPLNIEALMDPISERELEVLSLIGAGLSNREIAEKLFISLNTVKTHTKNINSKLNVNSRTKAIARAKELGLL
jgi:LuxR family maltose regulon positive regulatory protein